MSAVLPLDVEIDIVQEGPKKPEKCKRMGVFRGSAGRLRQKETLKFVSHTRGKAVRSSTKQVIVNMMVKLSDGHPDKKLDEIFNVIEDLTGISKTTIKKIRKEAKKGKLVTPAKCRPKAQGTRTRLAVMDDLQKDGLRRHIHGFFFRNDVPTLQKVLRFVNEDDSLPSFSMSSLYRHLKDLGFHWLKQPGRRFLVEKDEIVVCRRQYLRHIRKYRAEGRKIYYVDETCVNSGHASAAQLQKEGLPKPKSSFGPRFVVFHIGSSDGFVRNGLLSFRAKKSAGDFHQAIEGNRFEAWFVDVLQHLEKNSVIVLDDAPYHSERVELIPSVTTRKDEIQAWLTSKEIAFTPCMVKSELLNLVNQVKHRYSWHNTDRMAQVGGHSVLRLPPHHSELNPFEMVWSQVKSHVARNNRTFEPAEVERLIRESVDTVGSENWKSYINDVKTVEDRFWDLDHVADMMVDNAIVDNGKDSDTSYSDDSVM